MDQISFYKAEYNQTRGRSRRKQILEQMNSLETVGKENPALLLLEPAMHPIPCVQYSLLIDCLFLKKVQCKQRAYAMVSYS